MDKDLANQIESAEEFLRHMFNTTGDTKYQKELKKNAKLLINETA